MRKKYQHINQIVTFANVVKLVNILESRLWFKKRQMFVLTLGHWDVLVATLYIVPKSSCFFSFINVIDVTE